MKSNNLSFSTKVGAVASLVMLLTSAICVAESVRTHVFADGEVRVTFDGDVAHVESPVAASATDPNVIYAASEVLYPGRPLSKAAAQIYYSHDAGGRWNPVPLATEMANGGWDNEMVTGKGGVAFFITHDSKRGLTAYRTDDGGVSWASSLIDSRPTWDREYAVVDNTESQFSGRLYIEGEGFINSPKPLYYSTWSDHYGVDGIKVISSADGGKSFGKPVMACHRDGMGAEANPHPVVMSDGTLIVTCFFYPEGKPRNNWMFEEFGIAASADGGKSFSPYRSVAYLKHRLTTLQGAKGALNGDFLMDAIAPLAVAPASGIFPDRLYTAWSTYEQSDRLVIYLAHSDDRGITWSKPVPVDPIGAGRGARFREAMPMLAVNRDGTVGLAWFDGRDAPNAEGYDVYFTASVDGGNTFTTAVRLTSSTSHPQRGGQDTIPAPRLYDAPPKLASHLTHSGVGSGISIQFISPFELRPVGGDFATMTADSWGRFHPLWPDARDGTWQLYTATIHVLSENQLQAEVDLASTTSHACDVTPDVHLILGLASWDPVSKIVAIPVQVQNIGETPFVKPLFVRVDGGGSAFAHRPNTPKALISMFPPETVFDPASGRFTRVGIYKYVASTDRPLFEMGVTKSQVWKFRVRQEVTGFHPMVHVKSLAPSCMDSR